MAYIRRVSDHGKSMEAYNSISSEYCIETKYSGFDVFEVVVLPLAG